MATAVVGLRSIKAKDSIRGAAQRAQLETTATKEGGPDEL
jgi:hypothetical protein